MDWSALNPFDTSKKNFWDYVPVVAAGRDLAEGKSIPETVGDATFLAPAIGGVQDVYGAAKNKVNAAYDQKKAGYDAVQADIKAMQEKRMQQKQYAYDLANQAFEPSRKAMAAVYGDPSTWKL